jgi:hypothetical protein
MRNAGIALRVSRTLLAAAFVPLAAGVVAAAPVALFGHVAGPVGARVAGGAIVAGPLASLFDDPAAPLATGVLDPAGDFRLEAAAAGLLRVTARCSGCAPLAIDVPAVEDIELPSVQAVPPRDLVVRVADPAGRPVADARVQAESAAGEPAAWRTAPLSATTGADGTARLAVAPGVPLRLLVAVTSWPGEAREIAAAELAPIEVRLRPGSRRTIEVRDRAGRPVEGVAAAAVSGLRLGATDAAGRLEVIMPRGEEISLLLLDRSGRWAKATLQAGDPQAPAGPAVLTLRAPEAVHGRVIDSASRRPLPEALVWTADGSARPVRTDGEGRYSLAVPFGAAPAIRAAAAGHLAASAAAGPPPAGPGPTLVLPPAAAVPGTVVDAAGRPVVGAEVRAKPADAWSSDGGVRSRSRADGSFRLAGLLPGGDYRLRASRDGFLPRDLRLAAPAPGAPPRELRLVLERGRPGVGRVVDAAGRPVVGAEVRLLPAAFAESPDALRTVAEVMLVGLTDGSGRFSLQPLGRGPFDLRARAPGFAPALVRGVKPAPGPGAANLGTIVLEPGAVLEGRVIDPGGSAIAGAAVEARSAAAPGVWDRARPGELPGVRVESGAGGEFSLAGLRPGESVTLRVLRRGYAPRTLTGVAVPSPEPLVLVLAPAARLAGSVVDDSGAPVAGATLLVAIDPGQGAGGAGNTGPGGLGRSVGGAQADAAGRFAVEDLEAGTFRLTALAPGFLRAGVEGIAVPAGGARDDLEIVLHRGAVVEGRVLDPAGRPVSGASVTVAGNGGPSGSDLLGRPQATSDGEGRYLLGGMALGMRAVLAEHPDFLPARRDVDVQAGTNRVDLQLGGAFEVAGRVLAAAGPVAGARVSLAPLGESLNRAAPTAVGTGPDGAFRFPAVATGRYRLQAEASGLAPGEAPEEVQVEAGPISGLEVHLEKGAAVVGRILGLDAAELARLEVRASAPDLPGQAGRLGSDGRYRIDGLLPGEWTVSADVTATGREASGRVSLAHGQAEAILDLRFGGGLVLSGMVTSAGVPVVGALVTIRNPGGEGGDAVTGPDGRFRVDGLAPGVYAIAAIQPRSGQRQEVQVKMDSDREIALALPSAAPASAGGRPPA